MKLTDESWLSYQKAKGEDSFKAYMADLTDMQEHVLPCLQSFCSLEEKAPVRIDAEINIGKIGEQHITEKMVPDKVTPKQGALSEAGKAMEKKGSLYMNV